MRHRSAERPATCPPPRRPRRQPTTGPAAEAELAELGKAVGHPARVRILRLLLARTACVCGELVDELPLAQSTVSQHLKVLKDAGLIRGEIDGPRIGYCVEPAALRRLAELSAALVALLPDSSEGTC